jgi:hypothetical protein
MSTYRNRAKSPVPDPHLSDKLDTDPALARTMRELLIRKKHSELTLSVGSSLPGSTASPWGVSTLQRSATDMAQDISTSTTRDSARIASTNLDFKLVLWVSIDFSTDPDSGSQTNADPQSHKIEFLHQKYT